MKSMPHINTRIMRYFVLLLIAILPQAVFAQSIAELARKADIEQNPLHVFSFVSEFKNGYAIVGKEVQTDDGSSEYRYGVADENGHLHIPLDYISIELAGEDENGSAYMCRKNNRYGVINIDKKIILPFDYDEATIVDGRGGEGPVVIDYTVWIVHKGGKEGLLYVDGSTGCKWFAPCTYDNISQQDDYYYVTYNHKKGVLDGVGNVIVPDSFSYIGNFGNGYTTQKGDDDGKQYVWVKNEGQYGIYDNEGEELQPCGINKLFTESSEGAKFDIDFGKYPGWKAEYVYTERQSGIGIINGRSCKTIIPSIHEYISPIINGKAWFMDNDKWGVVDTANTLIQQPIYDEVVTSRQQLRKFDVPENLFGDNFYVRKDSLWGLLNSVCATVVEAKYDSLGEYHDSLMLAKADGKYGYLGINGDVAIPFLFYNANDFSEGLAAVQNEPEKYFFIDTTGTMVIKPHKFDCVGSFVDGKCQVWRKGKTWFINREGNKIK